MRLSCISLVATIFGLTAITSSPAFAYLGGFENADGYALSTPIVQGGAPPISVYTDVTYYNAGQSGANAGGGVATAIVPDSGLWKLVTNAGAFFRTPADRALHVGTAPPYGAAPNNNFGVPAYIVGEHFNGYLSPHSLALRNETPVNNVPVGGPMEYDYTLDTFDYGGQLPASITSGVITTSFRFCPNPGQPSQPGTKAPDKFIMSFRDTIGMTGLQIGYANDNEVYWRPGNAGSWNYTGILANASNWDQFSVSIDLTNDTFGIDYHQIATNTNLTLAPTGTPLGNPMLDQTHLRWWLRDQVVGGIGGKNFFDNFGFGIHQVPEPSCVLLGGIGAMALTFFRRR